MIQLYRMLIVVLLSLVSGGVLAQASFLVIGSFSDEQDARQAGERIATDTGVEVLLHESLVDGRSRYRLLTGGDDRNQAALRAQLLEAGIGDSWTLRFESDVPYMEMLFGVPGSDFDSAELAAIDATLRDMDAELLGDSRLPSNHVVAGSFSNAARAEAEALRLAGALGRTVFVDGADEGYHRVLIGPVATGSENSIIAELAVHGVVGAWVRRSDKLPGKNYSSENLLVSEGIINAAPVERRPGTGTPEWERPPTRIPGEESKFNLARIGSAAKWPDPRKGR